MGIVTGCPFHLFFPILFPMIDKDIFKERLPNGSLKIRSTERIYLNKQFTKE